MKTGVLVAALALIATGAHAQSYGPAYGMATTAPASSLSTVPARTLFGFHVTVPSAGMVMIFDGAAPPDGPVTPRGCFTIPAPVAPATAVTVAMANTPIPVLFSYGPTLVYSSGSDCFTKVTSAVGYISVIYGQ